MNNRRRAYVDRDGHEVAHQGCSRRLLEAFPDRSQDRYVDSCWTSEQADRADQSTRDQLQGIGEKVRNF
jgi:hypothetical protein